MLRKLNVVIAAGFGALSFAGGAGAFGTVDFPTSVNESDPIMAQHATAPSATAPKMAVGGTRDAAPMRELGSMTYEVQVPSSVNESAPQLTGSRHR